MDEHDAVTDVEKVDFLEELLFVVLEFSDHDDRRIQRSFEALESDDCPRGKEPFAQRRPRRPPLLSHRLLLAFLRHTRSQICPSILQTCLAHIFPGALDIRRVYICLRSARFSNCEERDSAREARHRFDFHCAPSLLHRL